MGVTRAMWAKQAVGRSRSGARAGRARWAVLGLVALLLVGCNPRVHTYQLSRDNRGGRAPGTEGWQLAVDWITQWTKGYGLTPINDEPGPAGYLQHFPGGTNIIGILPGSDLAHEHVVVGAHFDHLSRCATEDPADTLCNGATDNATGVAATLELARRLSSAPEPPRRSVVFAFWDLEEVGLRGSQHYVQNPVVPLADTVAYVNFDILGANLLPSLRSSTFALGAESGGALLQGIVGDAAAGNDLDVAPLSAIFGMGRSDYANFFLVGIPTVFFSDSTGRCYHTAQDEPEIVDFAKLDHQIDLAHEVTVALANGDARPTFTPSTMIASYQDAVTFAGVIERALDDLDLLSPADQTTVEGIRTTARSIVDAGEAAFDATSANLLLAAASQAIDVLTHGPCDGFLP